MNTQITLDHLAQLKQYDSGRIQRSGTNSEKTHFY